MPLCDFCKQEITTINAGFLGDVKCPVCGILNSFYPKEGEEKQNEVPLLP